MLLVPAAVGAQSTSPLTCLGTGDVAPPSRALFARLVVGGSTLDLTPCLRGAGKVHTLSATFFLAGVSSGTINATYDEDPFINVALASTNIGAGPTDYTFFFSTPIVGGVYTNAISSLSGSLTAGATEGTLTNQPGPIPFLRGYGTNNGAPTGLGVDIGVATCATTTSVNCPAAPAAGANAFAPTFYNDLEAELSYRQGGAGSQAAFTGRVEIFTSTVPEPATLALFATGAVVLGAGTLARRRRR